MGCASSQPQVAPPVKAAETTDATHVASDADVDVQQCAHARERAETAARLAEMGALRSSMRRPSYDIRANQLRVVRVTLAETGNREPGSRVVILSVEGRDPR